MYGKTVEEAKKTQSDHIISIMPDAQRLTGMEIQLQDQFLSLQMLIDQVMRGGGKGGQQQQAGGQQQQQQQQGGDGSPQGSPQQPQSGPPAGEGGKRAAPSAPKGMATYGKKK